MEYLSIVKELGAIGVTVVMILYLGQKVDALNENISELAEKIAALCAGRLK